MKLATSSFLLSLVLLSDARPLTRRYALPQVTEFNDMVQQYNELQAQTMQENMEMPLESISQKVSRRSPEPWDIESMREEFDAAESADAQLTAENSLFHMEGGSSRGNSRRSPGPPVTVRRRSPQAGAAAEAEAQAQAKLKALRAKEAQIAAEQKAAQQATYQQADGSAASAFSKRSERS